MSLKHVVHKRVHLERPQPLARKKLGYLEKHKDYVKRAKDYHRKEDAIKKLHRKAYFKNEDEFNFSMVSHHQKDGRVRKNGTHLDEAELSLADSQDARYIRMREQIDKRAVEKATEGLHFLDAERPNKHMVFVDDDDEDVVAGGSASSGRRSTTTRPGQKLRTFDVAGYFDTHPALLGRKANRPRLKQLETKNFEHDPELENHKRQAYRELFHRQERAKKLGRVRTELELRSDLRGKGRRKKVSDAVDGRPAVYKWVSERKR